MAALRQRHLGPHHPRPRIHRTLFHHATGHLTEESRFSDARLERRKPCKQLFLAYRRPGLDRAACSAPAAAIGRLRTAEGYALEALIPWDELGLPGVPDAEFGLDLLIDIADVDGRRLQLTCATGTSEAWITAARYLTVAVKL